MSNIVNDKIDFIQVYLSLALALCSTKPGTVKLEET